MVETAIHEKARCSGVLVCGTEEEKVTSSSTLYCKSTSWPSALGDQYQKAIFIVYVPTNKRSLSLKVIQSSKQLK